MLCCLDYCADIPCVRLPFYKRKHDSVDVGKRDKTMGGQSRNFPEPQRKVFAELALSPHNTRQDDPVVQDQAEELGSMRSEPRDSPRQESLKSPLSDVQQVADDPVEQPPKLATPDSIDLLFRVDGAFDSVQRDADNAAARAARVPPGYDMPMFSKPPRR